jgi:hypothetical protein
MLDLETRRQEGRFLPRQQCRYMNEVRFSNLSQYAGVVAVARTGRHPAAGTL